MGFLELPDGLPAFSKGIISLWFRVPQASIDAASAESLPTFDRELARTIPLLTCGQRLTKNRYPDLHGVNVRVDHWDTGSGTPGPSDGLFTLAPASYGAAVTDKISPWFIGLECSGGNATLTFNFQMSDYATVAWLLPGILVQDRYLDRVFIDPTNPNYPASILDPGIEVPGSGWEGSGIWFGFSTLWDRTPIELNAQPEVFTVQSTHRITPDRWHHLLLSFDLSLACMTHGPGLDGGNIDTGIWDTVPEGTDSYCKLWYAVDDVDYRGGPNMKPYPVDYNITDDTYGGVGDPNGILTQNAWRIVTEGMTWYVNNAPYGPATCEYATPPIPSNVAALGIPAAAVYKDHIYTVETAKMQMFTGVSLDTFIEDSRRLFITSTGKSANFALARVEFGRPAIEFDTQQQWLTGSNGGSAGDFERTGTISEYPNDPSL